MNKQLKNHWLINFMRIVVAGALLLLICTLLNCCVSAKKYNELQATSGQQLSLSKQENAALQSQISLLKFKESKVDSLYFSSSMWQGKFEQTQQELRNEKERWLTTIWQIDYDTARADSAGVSPKLREIYTNQEKTTDRQQSNIVKQNGELQQTVNILSEQHQHDILIIDSLIIENKTLENQLDSINNSTNATKQTSKKSGGIGVVIIIVLLAAAIACYVLGMKIVRN
jgi:hypothetical protein